MTEHHGQFGPADARMVLDLLGCDDTDDEDAAGFRYATREAFTAHAVAERRFGNRLLGPAVTPDGIFGVVILSRQDRSGGTGERRCPCATP